MSCVTVVNIDKKFAQFTQRWSPKIVGEVNDCHVKLAKLHGPFVWHHHEHEDEMFLVIRGCLRIRLRGGEVAVNEGEFVVIPRGMEHMPVADEEVHVMLFEPKATVNTGIVTSERTVQNPDRI